MFTIFGAMGDRRFPCLSKERGRFITAETFSKFPSFLRVIDRSDRNPSIAATSVTFWSSLRHASGLWLVDFDTICRKQVRLTEISETFPRVFCFPKSRINENGRYYYYTTHLYTWVERSTVRAKCLAQEYNTMSPARARTRTARSGDERTNHEAIVAFHMIALKEAGTLKKS